MSGLISGATMTPGQDKDITQDKCMNQCFNTIEISSDLIINNALTIIHHVIYLLVAFIKKN